VAQLVPPMYGGRGCPQHELKGSVTILVVGIVLHTITYVPDLVLVLPRLLMPS
jgi:hypothetical protein